MHRPLGTSGNSCASDVPTADLGFKNWLIDNGVLSLTTRQRPGPIPPEVGGVTVCTGSVTIRPEL
jgi:hypothetical protein